MHKIKQTRFLIAVAVLILAVGVGYFMFVRLSPSDCTSVEKYDALAGACYYDCNTDEECEKKEKQVDAELRTFFSDSQSKIAKKDKNTSPASTQIKGTLLDAAYTGSETKGKIYTVVDEARLQPEPSAQDQKLWDLFVAVASKSDIKQYVQSFEVFDDDQNDSAASVWQSQEPGKWHVNVNAAYANDSKDLLHTMIHEYGHIVSLNSNQVARVDGACPRLELSEGCANDGAYIKLFKEKFWNSYGDSVPSNEGEDPDEVADFYEQHKASFVTEYAASNFVEDFAESWAMFVINDKPTGQEGKDQKVTFFYDQSQLVDMRNRIRTSIARDIVR
jgi:hypothetical protein